MGLAMGLMVAKFGKMLCLVVGAAMMIVEVGPVNWIRRSILNRVQILAREGIDIIPPGKVKQWVQEMDIRGLILKNSAFK